MRSVIVASLLIAVAGCAHPVKTTHIPDPAYAQTHITPAPSCTPGAGRGLYEFCMYAEAQSRCVALAKPSQQSCLDSLEQWRGEVLYLLDKEKREGESHKAEWDYFANKQRRPDVQSMEREMNQETTDIANSMRQIDQEQKMKDLENRTNDKMRSLEQEQDHLRAIDHDD
jgi:hypothetical protein